MQVGKAAPVDDMAGCGQVTDIGIDLTGGQRFEARLRDVEQGQVHFGVIINRQLVRIGPFENRNFLADQPANVRDEFRCGTGKYNQR